MYKNKLILLFLSLSLVACSKGTGIEGLDNILSPTDTQAKERTAEWYSTQDRVRSDVLDQCYDHFKSKIEREFDSEKSSLNRLVYDMQQIESNFDAIPDCKNAIEATNLVLDEERKSRTVYDYEIDQVKSEVNKTTSNEEIEALSAEVAKSLLKDQETSNKAEATAEQQANEYLVEDGKIDQIMDLSDETLKKADKALEDSAKTEVKK